MSFSLPEKPSLEHLRKQAKQLLSSYRKGDAQARLRLSALPGYSEAKPAALHDAQFAIAREYGFASWTKLVTEVERRLARHGVTAEVADDFLDAATTDREGRRLRLLELYPNLPVYNSLTALVCGQADRVKAAIAADSTFATSRSGAKNWTPLEYCCYSRMFKQAPEAYEGLEECARLLLDAGAEPNSSHQWTGDDNAPLSALYGAAGETGHAGIVKLLLEHGAKPNDGESMYHSAQHNWREIMELLVEHGGDVDQKGSKWNNTPIFFLCGWRSTDPGYDEVLLGIEWLLDHGADPNIICYPKKAAETSLHCACRTDGTKLVDLLLSHGANPAIRRADGKTAYELALITGNEYAAKALQKIGSEVELSPGEAGFAAAAMGDAKAATIAKEWASSHMKEAGYSLCRLAEYGRVAGVRTLLAAGIPVSIESDNNETPLHFACFTGQIAVVGILLSFGAPLDVRDDTYKATPLEWALESLGWHRRPDVDYGSLIAMLLDAGASKERVQEFFDKHQEDIPVVKVALEPLL